MALQYITGVFLKDTKKGEKYFSFTLDNNRYAVFKNNKPKTEKSAPYTLVRFADDNEQAQTAAPANRKPQVVTAKQAAAPAPVASAADEDLPF